MPLYILRSACSQLGCLVLTLALLAFPLAGTKPEHAPILIPLATHLVPLGASLQSPSGSPFQLPSFLAPGRLVLGPLPSPPLAPNLYSDSRLHITSHVFRYPGATDRPNCRSPPSA